MLAFKIKIMQRITHTQRVLRVRASHADMQRQRFKQQLHVKAELLPVEVRPCVCVCVCIKQKFEKQRGMATR